MRVSRAIAAAGVAVLVAFSIPQAKAVIGGTVAEPGSIGFMASLQTRDGFHFCGGSVISQWRILTAAHCVDGRSPGDLRIVTGRNDLGGSGGQDLGASRIFVHPSASSSGYRSHDVALIELSSPTNAPAIGLAHGGDDDLEADGVPVTVAGWGDTLPTYGLFSSNQLRRADLNVVDDGECGPTNPGFTASTGVCASYLLRDSCHGDSGGPLWGVKSGRRVQIGIVSWGHSCAIPVFPGVYSEVNNPSIREFIWVHSGI